MIRKTLFVALILILIVALCACSTSGATRKNETVSDALFDNGDFRMGSDFVWGMDREKIKAAFPSMAEMELNDKYQRYTFDPIAKTYSITPRDEVASWSDCNAKYRMGFICNEQGELIYGTYMSTDEAEWDDVKKDILIMAEAFQGKARSYTATLQDIKEQLNSKPDFSKRGWCWMGKDTLLEMRCMTPDDGPAPHVAFMIFSGEEAKKRMKTLGIDS